MYEELMTYDESTIAFESPEMFVIPSTFGKRNHYTQAKKALKEPIVQMIRSKFQKEKSLHYYNRKN